MRQTFASTLSLGAVTLAVVLYPAHQASATDPVGYKSTPYVQGRFAAIDLVNYFVPPTTRPGPATSGRLLKRPAALLTCMCRTTLEMQTAAPAGTPTPDIA